MVLRVQRSSRSMIVCLAAGAIAIASSLTSMAAAETYTTPVWPVLSVGTEGSDTGTGDITISQGGCAGSMSSSIALAVGESNRQCTSYYRWHNAGSEATGTAAALGLMEADATSFTLAVTDTGDASGQCWTSLASWTSCDVPAAAVSGTGRAWGQVAVSGTGSATSSFDDGGYTATRQGVAASGTGPAYADNPDSAAASGLGNATANTVAVSGLGTARARGCSGDIVQDALWGFAVSVMGNAYGCHSASVTGEAGDSTP